MGKLEGKVNDKHVSYEPSRLAVLFERLAMPMPNQRNFSEETRSYRKGKTRKIVKVGPLIVNGDQYTLEIGLENGLTDLVSGMEEPESERIEIRPKEQNYQIIVDRNPQIRGRWRNDTIARVQIIYDDGRTEKEKKFSIYSLSELERYVRSLLP